MRVVGVSRINLDLFLGPAAGIPAWHDAQLWEQGMGATHVVVARVIELRPSVLQFDRVVGVYGYAAERVANRNPEMEGEEISQIQDSQRHNYHGDLAFHPLNVPGQIIVSQVTAKPSQDRISAPVLVAAEMNFRRVG